MLETGLGPSSLLCMADGQHCNGSLGTSASPGRRPALPALTVTPHDLTADISYALLCVPTGGVNQQGPTG